MSDDARQDVEESPEMQEALSGACYCLAVRRASRRLISIYDAELAEHGLTISQFAMLAWVHAMSRPTVQRIADRMEMDQSALSRGLMPLERDGLLTSKPDPKDKRKRVLKLTEDGSRRLREGASSWARAQRRVEEMRPSEEPDLSALIAGINALGAVPGQSPE